MVHTHSALGAHLYVAHRWVVGGGWVVGWLGGWVGEWVVLYGRCFMGGAAHCDPFRCTTRCECVRESKE